MSPINCIELVRGLSSRDTLPNRRHTYELILTYKLNQVRKKRILFVVAKILKKAISCNVTVESPVLNDLLYESDFDSQMCQIFDSGKRRLHISDAFPKSVTLDKVGLCLENVPYADPSVGRLYDSNSNPPR
jgi:hypothetical protein